MAFRHVLIVIGVVAMWAFNVVAIKVGVTELPPLFMTLLRFVVVAAVVVPFTRINRAQLRTVSLLAFTFGFMHFSLLFVGLRYTDAGTAAIVVQLGTPFAMIMAALFLKEKLRLIQVIGILLSLSGVFFLAGSPSLASWLALVLLLTSAWGWAITNIIVKCSPAIHPLTMAGWLSFFAIPMVGTASLICEHDQLTSLIHSSWRGWFAVLYSAIGSSVIAYSLWYWLLKKYPVNKVMPYSLLSPVFAIFMGAYLLDDSLNHYKLIGAGLIVGGIFIALVNLKDIFKTPGKTIVS
ncbi:EamA family transporter [Brenneria roseae subsp. americana]|uniref:EamA family transporter n=1 Tax=Brenneria roseae subsp. americana TaxID=1508507 RepID=A0A2U1TNX2_9GAMM|nr:EamA family transporter [Brenneria roseae]PWC11106.1 EamA family transporter [Brenneria roseae subsp. americana]